MFLRARAPLVVIFFLFLVPGRVATQSDPGHRVTVGANIGVHTGSATRTDVAGFSTHREIGSVRGTQTLAPYTVFDGGGSTLVWKSLGVGLSVSHAGGKTTANVEAKVPHPFFFDFHRTATASAKDLEHRELIYHVSAQLAIPLGSSTRLTVLAGPSRFDASQDLVSGIETSEQGFPFDSVDIVASHVERLSVKSWGYHVGVDLAYHGLRRIGVLSRSALFDHVGVGVLVRYSRSRPSIELQGIEQPDLQLGSLHAVGGLRVGF